MRTYEEVKDEILHSLEGELRAAAAGYPGAEDDVTVYVQAEMIEESYPQGLVDLLRRTYGIQ